MFGEEAGELHHVEGRFAAEEFGELGVGDDEALVLFVLEVVGFDVVPDFFEGGGAGEGGFACDLLEDGGEGVSEDQRGNLFEPFFTTSAKGTGLGLAISRKIARELGGELYYEALEPGSRFTLVVKARKEGSS